VVLAGLLGGWALEKKEKEIQSKYAGTFGKIKINFT
jgi:hypothetical protein